METYISSTGKVAPARTTNRKYTALTIVLVITIIGGFLRISGADWAFPILGHPDEATIVKPAYNLVEKGGWDPNTYLRPNHFSIYLNSIAYRVLNPIVFDTPITDSYKNHTTFFYLCARTISGIFGTLLIPASYLIAREFTQKWAWIASLLTGVYPSFTIHSHYATPDVSLTLLSALSFLFSIKYCKSNRLLPLVISIAFAALSVSEKYPCAANTLVIGSVVILNPALNWKQKLGYTFGSAFIFLIFLGIFAPYLFLNFDKVLFAVYNESRSVHHGADGLGFLGNINFYIDQLTQGAGITYAILGLFGTGLAIFLHKRAATPLLSPLWYLLLFGVVPLHWERWGLPIYFVLLINATIAIAWILERPNLKRWFRRTIVCIFSIPAVVMLAETILINREFNAEDARVASAAYCEKNGITKENSYYEHYTPFAPRGGSPYGTFSRAVLDRPSEFRYILISSRMYGRFYLEPDRYPQFIEGHQMLMKYHLVKKFPATHFTSIWRKPKPKLALLNGIEIAPTLFETLTSKNTNYSGTTIHIFDRSIQVEPEDIEPFSF